MFLTKTDFIRNDQALWNVEVVSFHLIWLHLYILLQTKDNQQAEHDYRRFPSILLKKYITVIGNEMLVQTSQICKCLG